MRNFQFYLISILFVLSLSCSSPSGSYDPIHSPLLTTPIVTGLYITNSDGPNVLAVWGDPSEGSSISSILTPPPADHSGRSNKNVVIKPLNSSSLPTEYSFPTPFPNPSPAGCTFEFIIPVESKVDLWAVHAQWVGSRMSNIGIAAGAEVSTSQKTPAAVFIQDQQLPAGYYLIQWDRFQPEGNSVTPGFYRIYFRVNNTTYWRDVLFYDNITDLPSDLRKLFSR